MINESTTFPNWEKHLSLAKLPTSNPGTMEDVVQYERYAITPIEHDYAGLTPSMWNAAYKYFGMNAVMAMMVGDPKNADEILNGFKNDPKYIGGGSGIGFKDVNVEFVDELDPLAGAMGSVNLIQKLPFGKLKGWNTDGIGYRQGLEDLLIKKGLSLSGAKVVILGAGGTCNAVALALAEKGAQVVILNRTPEKAEEIARRTNEYVGSTRARAGGEYSIAEEVSDAAVVVNVSTKGATGAFEKYSALAPASLPATSENILKNLRMSEGVFAMIPKNAIISDVVLRNTPSPFLEMAHKLGFTTQNGVPMVINQGVEAFMVIHGDEIGAGEEARRQLRKIMQKAADI